MLKVLLMAAFSQNIKSQKQQLWLTMEYGYCSSIKVTETPRNPVLQTQYNANIFYIKNKLH